MIMRTVERPDARQVQKVRLVGPPETRAAGIGRRLREARRADGLTPLALSREADVPHQTIVNIEWGKRKVIPNAVTLAKLARATGVTMDWLYWGDE